MKALVVCSLRTLTPLFALLFAFVCSMDTMAQSQEETKEFPLGPIEGTYRITPGKNWARVVSVTPGGPGAVAGLQVNDLIIGAFNKSFTPTGSKLGETQPSPGHYGVTQDLGFAV